MLIGKYSKGTLPHRTLRVLKEISNVLLLTHFLFCFNSFALASSGNDDFLEKLKSIKGTFIKEIETTRPYANTFEIWLNQPIDHNNPSEGTFQQRLFISHVSESAPTVIFTDGYEVTWPKKREPSTLLNANKIEVEHRFYGVSKPDVTKLKYFTSWQAANDIHRIIELLKPIYPGKWISSGKSLGGMSAYIHRSYYPDDVEVTVCFVAPLMFGREDPRFIDALKTELGAETLARLEEIQKELLRNRNQLETAIKSKVSPAGIYTSFDELLEYSVLNLPFAVYKKHLAGSIDIPPPGTDIENLLTFFVQITDFSYFSRTNAAVNQNVQYQTTTELGYYNYPRKHLDEYLQIPSNLDCSIFSPDREKGSFNPAPMQQVMANLRTNSSRIIYIYGEKDIWTPCAVDITGMTNSVKIIQPGASHNVRLKDLSPAYKDIFTRTLQKWLEVKIQL